MVIHQLETPFRHNMSPDLRNSSNATDDMAIKDRLPTGTSIARRRGAFAGFAAGVFVPLVLAGLFLVSFRGYGITESAPQIPPVYTDF